MSIETIKLQTSKWFPKYFHKSNGTEDFEVENNLLLLRKKLDQKKLIYLKVKI